MSNNETLGIEVDYKFNIDSLEKTTVTLSLLLGEDNNNYCISLFQLVTAIDY